MQGLLKVSGKDAEKFLQGQLTCNIPDAMKEPFLIGAHCNREGRVLSLFFLYAIHSDFYLLMPKEMVDITLNALKKYVVFFKVQLTNVSDLLCLTDKKYQLNKNDFIENNIPIIYPETSGKFLPHDINLHHLGGIHFDKGCYTGQEIIARMHYRGKLKTHLHKVTIQTNTALKPGDIVHKDDTVVDSYMKTPEDCVALIITQRDI